MNKTLRMKSGFILPSILFLSVILVIILIPLMSWVANEFSWSHRSFVSLRALNLADAGAELAIWEVLYDSALFTGWGGANPRTLQRNSFTDSQATVIGDIEISSLNTSPDNYLVTSTGKAILSTGSTVEKTVKVKIFPHRLFNNGIFGFSSVTLTGISIADSYNSGMGPYSALTAGSNSDIGSNGILSLQGTSMVKGDVLVGPSGAALGNDPAHMTGETFYSGNEVELIEYPSTTYVVYLQGLPLETSINLGSHDLFTIPSGDHRYDTMSVTGHAGLTISPNSNIYISGDLSIIGSASIIAGSNVNIYIGNSANIAGQGIINPSAIPNNLHIYGLGTSTISYAGGSAFYGTIYAPHSSVQLSGNADVFGAIVGDSVSLSGTFQFHYDESLSQNGPVSGYDIAYWQED